MDGNYPHIPLRARSSVGREMVGQGGGGGRGGLCLRREEEKNKGKPRELERNAILNNCTPIFSLPGACYVMRIPLRI